MRIFSCIKCFLRMQPAKEPHPGLKHIGQFFPRAHLFLIDSKDSPYGGMIGSLWKMTFKSLKVMSGHDTNQFPLQLFIGALKKFLPLVRKAENLRITLIKPKIVSTVLSILFFCWDRRLLTAYLIHPQTTVTNRKKKKNWKTLTGVGAVQFHMHRLIFG